jgi:hypothetical protein
MNNEFEQMMKSVKKNYSAFLRRIGEANNISDKLYPIIDAMSRGITGDYRLKEALIESQR